MPAPRRRGPSGGGIHIEWFTITTRSIYFTLGVVVVLAASGYFGYQYFRTLMEPKSTVNTPPATDRRSAHFLELTGTVKVKKAGTWDWQTAYPGTPLEKGDTIRTVGKSTARVRFFDGTEHALTPETILVIEESREDPETSARQVAVKLTSGQVNLQTARRSAPDSTSELLTPKARTQFGEMTTARVGFEEGTEETEVAIYRGDGVLTAGSNQLKLQSDQVVRVSSTQVFSEITRLPAVPVTVAPSNFAQVVHLNPVREKTRLAWKAVAGAATYHVQLFRGSTAEEPVVDNDEVRDVAVIVPGLPSGSYLWRVAAIDEKKNAGGFSELARFTVSSEELKAKPPTLLVSEPEVSPLEGLVTLSGHTDEDVLLTVNDEKVGVKPGGQFRHYISLSGTGKHAIVIKAQSRNGGVAEKTFVVTVGQQ